MRLTLSVILLTFSVIACGMPTVVKYPAAISAPVPVSKDTYVNSEMSTDVNTAPVCGYWNIREEPDPDSASIGIAPDVVTLKGVAEAPDGGLWVEVEGGWMNAKGLCDDNIQMP